MSQRQLAWVLENFWPFTYNYFAIFFASLPNLGLHILEFGPSVNHPCLTDHTRSVKKKIFFRDRWQNSTCREAFVGSALSLHKLWLFNFCFTSDMSVQREISYTGSPCHDCVHIAPVVVDLSVTSLQFLLQTPYAIPYCTYATRSWSFLCFRC